MIVDVQVSSKLANGASLLKYCCPGAKPHIRQAVLLVTRSTADTKPVKDGMAQVDGEIWPWCAVSRFTGSW